MNNIEHDYLKLLKDILDNGVEKLDRTSTGTVSIFGRQIRHDMSLGFPLLTTKKMPFKIIAAELLWFLRGDTNIKYLVDNNCHIWDGDAYKNYTSTTEHPLSLMEFIDTIKNDSLRARTLGELGPIYGKQWRNWNAIFDGGVDQIANLVRDIKTNPDSRRLMVTAWNPADLPNQVLPPCHYGFQVYTRELSLEERNDLLNKKTNRNHKRENCFSDEEFERETLQDCKAFNIPTRAISLMWNQRSVDTPLGLPFNIASYALLLELLAMEVNMVPDQLIGNLGDCHIYLNQVEGVKEQLWRQPLRLGKLSINTEFWNPDAGVFEQQDIRPEDFYVEGYESHPKINFPLSN